VRSGGVAGVDATASGAGRGSDGTSGPTTPSAGASLTGGPAGTPTTDDGAAPSAFGPALGASAVPAVTCSLTRGADP
jgi:hypothetical protein